jgi:hypothetical protein
MVIATPDTATQEIAMMIAMIAAGIVTRITAIRGGADAAGVA